MCFHGAVRGLNSVAARLVFVDKWFARVCVCASALVCASASVSMVACVLSILVACARLWGSARLFGCRFQIALRAEVLSGFFATLAT